MLKDIVIDLDDKELFELFMDESMKDKAFTMIVKKYQERLYWHIRRFVVHHEDTNDILQNVFVRAWKGLHNFRQEAGLYTWFYRVATNECLTYIANQKKKNALSLSDDEHGLSGRVKAEKGFDFKNIEWKLQLAIQTLPDKQRAVFNLRYYDEMPYEKMSEVLETSVGALKASYHHAAKKVSEFMLKEN
jgi:RNA polymerase sigma-70 factor (ECF subfamily)